MPMLLLASTATPPLQTFTRVHSVCSTCARPTASQGLRVVDASCAPNFTTTVDGCAAAARPTAEGAWDTKKDCLVIKGVKPGEPADWLRADPKAPMRFVPTAPSNVDFVPYFELDDEQMTVYPCYEI